MIDVHCHLEQEDYNQDRENIIEECKKKLKAVITCCALPKDWGLTKEIITKNKGFVFAIAGIHPEYIKDLSDKDIKEFIGIIQKEAKQGNIKAIGEIGLDFYWLKEEKFREKQKELFVKFIDLAKELNLPIVVHSRDAVSECIEILEKNGMKGKKVLLHLFSDKSQLQRVVENGWMISIGPGIQKSKTLKKIARDCPLQNLVIETDSPWFGFGERGTPLNTFRAAEEIAKAKKVSAEEVEMQADKNAISFFSLF